MEKIVINANIEDLGLMELAYLEQTQFQHENLWFALSVVTADDAEIAADSLILFDSDGNYHLLNAVERIKARNADDIVAGAAWSHAVDNCDSPACVRIEHYRWGLTHPREDEVTPAYVGECSVVIEGCCYGYKPYNYASDRGGQTITFSSYVAAQEWIDHHLTDDYYLSNNEVARPDFYIVG